MTTNGVQETTDRLEEHAPRLDWAKLAPEAYKAMIRLDTATSHGIEPTLLNLIKIRASQINHCAFCLDMHTKDALAAGESAERIIQLNAWNRFGVSTRMVPGHYTPGA
jgi:AhpD family alkylhydroperoxidase